MRILKAISFTVVSIIFLVTLFNLQVYCQETGITDSSEVELPIPIGGPYKEARKGIQDIKVNTKNEKDVYYWDEDGNLLERKYTECGDNNKCNTQIINYDPKRRAVLDGIEFTVQDARGALFLSSGDSSFGNTYYKPDERVLILEDKNIIAEYFRNRRSNNLTKVIIYDNGRISKVFILGEEQDESLRRKTDRDTSIIYLPPNTKLKEILKK